MDNIVETLCVYMSSGPPPMLPLYVGLGFVVGGFEVCTLSSFGQYFMLHFARWDSCCSGLLELQSSSTHAPALQQYFPHPRLVIYFFPSSIHPSMELNWGLQKVRDY
jgi:hypothetical protein